MTQDPPMSCQELGVVLGRTFVIEQQRQNMRTQAASMGGNYVRLDGRGGIGTAFRCPPEAFEARR
jgi:hypothetical protein